MKLRSRSGKGKAEAVADVEDGSPARSEPAADMELRSLGGTQTLKRTHTVRSTGGKGKAAAVADVEDGSPARSEPAADMELRSLCGTQTLKRTHTAAKNQPRQRQKLSQNGNKERQLTQQPVRGPPNAQVSSPNAEVVTRNWWSLRTTLELLHEIKAYVLRTCGTRIDWTIVASKMSNPHRMEPGKFARSCQVKFKNIRRCLKVGKGDALEAEVKESLAAYDETFKRLYTWPEIYQARKRSLSA